MERDAPTPCWGTVRDSTNSSGLFCSFFNSFFWPTLTPRRDFKKATKLGSASIDKERDREVIESLKILDNAYRSCYLSWSFHSHSTYPLLLCQLSFLFKLRHLTALWPPEHVNWGQLSGEVTPEREMINVFQGKAAKKNLFILLTYKQNQNCFFPPHCYWKRHSHTRPFVTERTLVCDLWEEARSDSLPTLSVNCSVLNAMRVHRTDTTKRITCCTELH